MMRLFSMICLVVSLFSSSLSYAGNSLPVTDTFPEPDKQFKVSGIKYLKKSDTIVVPSMYLHTLVEGTHHESKNGAHARVNYAVTNLGPELGEEIATLIYDDLIAKLKASGWKVLTYEDTKDQADWEKIGIADPLKQIGVEGYKWNWGYGDQYWMTSYPKGTPHFAPLKIGAPGTPDIFKITKKVGKKLDANVLFPVYTFAAPIAYGSTDRGYKKSTAEAALAPKLSLYYVGGNFMNPKAAGGVVQLKEAIDVADNVGTAERVEEVNQQDTSLFSFNVFRSVAKGDYAFTLDTESFKNAIVKTGKDFNTLLVAAYQEALPKK